MIDPLARLDDYDRTFLPEHLVAADRDADLHRLFRLEAITIDGTPRNAWYEAKVAANDVARYVSDIETAWSRAESPFIAPNAPGGAASLVLQVRYALVLASLTSLAHHLPPDLLAALVRSGLQTPETSLAIALRIPDPHRRARTVSRLAPLLVEAGFEAQITRAALDDDEARTELLAGIVCHISKFALATIMPTVLALDSEGAKAEVLAALASRDDLPPNVTAQTLDAVARWDDPTAQGKVLEAIIPRLDRRTLSNAWNIASAAGAIDALVGIALVALDVNEAERTARQEDVLARIRRSQPQKARTLARFGRPSDAVSVAESIRAPDTRAETLAGLAEFLSPAQLRATLTLTLEMRAQHRKIATLAVLAPHLDESALRDVLRAAVEFTNADVRAGMLGAIARYVPDTLVPELLEHTFALPRAHRVALVLAQAAPRLSEPELGTVLARVRRLRRYGDRGTVLTAIASYLSQAQADEAFAAAQRIADIGDRALSLDALAPRLRAEQLSLAASALEYIGDAREVWTLMAAVASLLPEERFRLLLDDALLLDDKRSAVAVAALVDQMPDAPAPETIVRLANAVRGRLSGLARGTADYALGRITGARSDERDEEQHLAQVRGFLAQAAQDRVQAVNCALRAAEILDPDGHSVDEPSFDSASLAMPVELGADDDIDAQLRYWHDELDRSARLSTLVEQLLERGLIGEARQVAQLVPTDSSRIRSLVLVARVSAPEDRALGPRQALAASTVAFAQHSVHIDIGVSGPVVVGIDALVESAHALDSHERVQLAELIVEGAQLMAGDDQSDAAFARAMARLLPHLEAGDEHRFRDWALRRAEGISDPELQSRTFTTLEPIKADDVAEWVAKFVAHYKSAKRVELTMPLVRLLVDAGHAERALPIFDEDLKFARTMTDRGERGRALALLAQFAAEFGTEFTGRLFQIEQDRSNLLHHLCRADRRQLLLDLAALIPALATGGDTALEGVLTAVEDVTRWWP